MIRYIVAVIFFSLSLASVRAQDKLKVEGRSPNLFIVHTVQKGDNYYSIGRKYHLPPREIAKANHLNFQEALKLHQSLHIPLTTDNFSQEKNSRGQPVYREVQRGETLYRVGLNSNKAPLANIRSWNHLSGDHVSTGQYLIIGWLRGGTDAAAVAVSEPVEKQADAVPAPAAAPAAVAAAPAGPVSSGNTAGVSPDNGGNTLLEEVIADEKARHGQKGTGLAIKKTGRNAEKQPIEEQHAEKQVVARDENDTPQKTSPPAQQAVAAPVEKKKDTVKEPNAFADMLSKIDAKPSAKPPVPKHTAAPAPVVHTPAAANNSVAVNNADTNNMTTLSPLAAESPFASDYLQQTTGNQKQVATEKGAGAWFKSNIAANTQKFYALNNSAPRGTIIKVTNPLNGKFVYVKVLDQIPQVGGNANLIIKIGDAAMQALGISSARFFCELQYGK